VTAADSAYAVTITVGTRSPAGGDSTVVDLTPDTVDAAAVIARVEASGLTPADLRSRTVVTVGGDPAAAVAVYATLIGLAGRYLDVSDGARHVAADQVARAAAAWPSEPRPSEPLLLAQLGADHPQLVSVGLTGALTPPEVAVVSYSRRLRFVPAGDAVAAIVQLIAVAAVRRRGVDDRLPLIVTGDEPVTGPVRDVVSVGLDLDQLRRAGQELRRRNLPDRAALVDAVAPDSRALHLARAAQADISETLIRLGARRNDDTGLWHCPRPDRHTNGDANASMKLTDGRTRCFRCDAERVDPLRLVIDTLACSGDEAADWILSAVG
jgi:hypothetical protein